VDPLSTPGREPDLIDPKYLFERALLEAMSPFWNNPHSSDHAFGWRAEEAVQEARQSVADLIGADTDEIVFTSGAMEANNLAFLGLLTDARKTLPVMIRFVYHDEATVAPTPIPKSGAPQPPGTQTKRFIRMRPLIAHLAERLASS
jgi:hypothetical protein